jgi:hypothetical protein
MKDMAKDEETRPENRDQTTDSYVGNTREGKVRQVEEEGLDAADLDPADPYVNLGHVGAGTIMPDGTYGAPLPDPMVKKLAEEAQELDTHGQDADQSPGIQRTTRTTKAAPAKKDPEPTK